MPRARRRAGEVPGGSGRAARGDEGADGPRRARARFAELGFLAVVQPRKGVEPPELRLAGAGDGQGDAARRGDVRPVRVFGWEADAVVGERVVHRRERPVGILAVDPHMEHHEAGAPVSSADLPAGGTSAHDPPEHRPALRDRVGEASHVVHVPVVGVAGEPLGERLARPPADGVRAPDQHPAASDPVVLERGGAEQVQRPADEVRPVPALPHERALGAEEPAAVAHRGVVVAVARERAAEPVERRLGLGRERGYVLVLPVLVLPALVLLVGVLSALAVRAVAAAALPGAGRGGPRGRWGRAGP